MGQYYKPVSIDKKEWVLSHDYDNGLKLMEHSYIGNTFVEIVEILLTEINGWYKNRIVWAGDCADNEKHKKKNLYELIGKDKNIIKPVVRKLDKKYRYLCNHSKKEFVDKRKIKKDKNDYKINPLPLLTCEGNGRGGGDFRGEDERIGAWARDIISLEEKAPIGYEEIDGQFYEG